MELDYHNEAKNLNDVRSNMTEAGFQPNDVTVPMALPEYTTKRMLVMDWVEGPKLMDGMRSYYAKWAEENGTTLKQLEEDARKKVEQQGIPSKYDGPPAWKLDMFRRAMKTGDNIANVGVCLYNWTLGWIATPLEYQLSVVPPNTPRIVDLLMRVHGHQLMKDGIFNSDPHGGNFLLTPDGRLGLIDYGATKRLSRNERLNACLLYAALGRRDERMLHDLCKLGGYKSKYGKKEVLMKLISFGCDSWGHDVTGGKNIQQFIDELKKEDPWEEIPDNLVLAQVRYVTLVVFI